MNRFGRVAYVCADPGVPVFGAKGCSVHARSILAELARRSDEVHLFAARRGGSVPADLDGVVHHPLPCPSGETAGRERALVEADGVLAERLGVLDGVDLVYQRYSLWSCAGMELAAARGWRSALEINAPLLDEQARHRGLSDRATAEDRTARAVRAASAPFGVSAGVAGWAERLAGRAVAVVPNGVDPDRFTPPAHRATRPGRRGEVVVGFVGTFRPWHDLDGVVDAVAAVARTPSAPPLRLLLVGDGPGRAPAVERARRLGVEVESTGSVPPDSVPGVLATMDVGLAVYGGDERYFSPLKVFEYLAAGVPVVASSVGGLDGLLRPGLDALLAPAGDHDALVAHLARLCSRPDLRRRLGRAGRRAAVERHSWSRVLDRVVDLLPVPGAAA